ncbi:transglycosylase SLT domain-containing protein [Conexibacter sp. JD483]|uniref:transglycosylase SLT domain-containing protein n=1 Tax=unclassified Conexibacter TaxID=2627773 RepID=UPI002719B879|nr:MULTISPECIES: transglycosylase SLT domain-containing protein [unclassified Conexibacter]MDO8186649.1 transglycosylase SLT domain-containing protein [Conexibacter sp. CPCC 205706]MDO8200369.1 transglycosylase SLT domain-containing protein [Conexibacter sp. CPCC 205762]MDR9370609.1 transglycosylase SLT domain-containing protein [Conexibacter sp. JD483]
MRGQIVIRGEAAAIGTARPGRRFAREERGQAALLLVAVMCVVLVGAVVLGGIAAGLGERGDNQRAADLGALGGARAMRAVYPRLFQPAYIGRVPNPSHLSRDTYLALARRRAEATARLNGAERISVAFPDGAAFAPTRIRVTVTDPAVVKAGGERREAAVDAVAEAELSPSAATAALGAGPGDYSGPLAYRQGKPMRPDVAIAFDRMAAAAARDGVALTITSGWRSSAEQARLFAAHPDPRWVAPPGRSLHRLGTELDLGPESAYGWLAANAGGFHFVRRMSWEPWHYGYTLAAGTTSVGYGGGGDGRGAMPSFVPAQFAPAISAAAQRWNVSAALLAAQLYAESGFNPFAVSPAGAQGIAQFMPGTARTYGLDNPFDATAAIDAQGRMMRDLLRQFGSVPLALAAYNAGPGAVSGCGCIPAYPETQAYVARIFGLLGGAGDSAGLGAGYEVRLVR